jgi:hypothetical protein
MYSHDTPEHWAFSSRGREIVEWPTKWLGQYKQRYTAEELKDWYCVTNTQQLNVGNEHYFKYFDGEDET